MPWIDFEEQRPPDGERVIALIPFGMRVRDDTWTDDYGWLNTTEYVSHWRPIDAPGTYTEIVTRPLKGEPFVPPPRDREGMLETLAAQEKDEVFSDAVMEHFRLMECLTYTQMKLRMEAKPSVPGYPTKLSRTVREILNDEQKRAEA